MSWRRLWASMAEMPGAPGGVVLVRRAVARKPEPQVQVTKKKGKK